jgi:excisionase family DNA binding protein
VISINIIPAYVYNITMNDVYSVSEAAKKLNLDPSQIRRLLAKGEIRGKKLGRDWVVLGLNYTRKRKPKGGKK